MPNRPVIPRMRIALTRGEVECLHEEIGDLPRAQAGPKLRELYTRLETALSMEWSEKSLREQQRRGARL